MDLERLAAYQKELAEKVSLVDGFKGLDRIAGVDVAYADKKAYGAAVVLDSDMNLLETKTARTLISFPYIPSFLSFREAEPMRAALGRLETDFDVLLVNGHGIAHPRGVGIASHLGVVLGLSTVGVAKGLLCGEVIEKLERRRVIVYDGREVGFMIAAKGKPLFISPGNKVTLESSLRIVDACMRDHRLPEPLWAAHTAASKAGGE